MIKAIFLATQNFYQENNPIAVFSGLLIAVFCSIQALFYGVVLAVMLNTLSGIWKTAIRRNRFIITARGLKRTIEKIGGYGIALATFGLLDVLIMNISNQHFIFTVSMVVAGMIILYEGKSIMDNMKEITGMNLFDMIYETAQSVFKRRVNADLDSGETRSTKKDSADGNRQG